MRAMVVAVALVLCSAPPAARALSLSVRNAELREVFRLIARAARMNVVLGPEVTGAASVDLKDVDPVEALSLVARMHGLAVGRRGGVTLVGSPAVVRSIVQRPEVRVFQVGSRPVEQVAEEVRRHYPGLVVTADPVTNCIIVSTPDVAPAGPPTVVREPRPFEGR